MTYRNNATRQKRQSMKAKIHKLPLCIINKIKDDHYFSYLSSNSNAIKLLEKPENKHKINWHYLSKNPNAISLLEQNIDKIDWNELSCNKNALHLLKDNKDKINWHKLCQNTNSNALSLLNEKIQDEENGIIVYHKDDPKCKNNINWYQLLLNPSAISLIENEMNKPKSKNKILKDKLGLIGLSEGNHINFLTNNKKYIQWTVLSGNKNAMECFFLNWSFEKTLSSKLAHICFIV